MDGPMGGVDPDEVDQEVGNFWRGLYKLEKGFDTVPAAKKIAGKVSFGYFLKYLFLSLAELVFLANIQTFRSLHFYFARRYGK